VVGAISSSLFVIGNLQSQVEELSKETEQQQSQLEAELAVKEQQQLELEQQQRELEEQQRELEREEVIRLQQQKELETQQRIRQQQEMELLAKQSEIEQQERIKQQQQLELEQQQRELEEQQRDLELRDLELLKRAQIEEMARTNPLVAGLIYGKLKFYIVPIPDYAGDVVKLGVDTLSAILENHEFYTNINVKFKRVYNPSDAQIHISWVKNYGSHVVGESIFKSVVKVGLGSENCYGDWQPFTAPTVMLIFLHEVGHSMGFGHSNNPDNIMYYKTDIKFETEYDEIIALDEGEYITLPFCSGGTILYQISSDDKNNGFHVYVLPPETDSSNFINYRTGKYYPDCSTENTMVTFGNECTVPNGAKLVIHNPDDIFNFDVIRVDVKIIDLDQVKVPADLSWDMSVFEYDEKWLNEIWNMYH